MTKIKLHVVCLFLFWTSMPAIAEESTQTITSWAPQCPSEHGAEGAPLLAAILVPKAVEVAFDAVGAAIQASANTNTVIKKSEPNYSFFYEISPRAELTPKNKCLIVRKGVYDPKMFANLSKNGTATKDIENDQMYFEFKLEAATQDRSFLKMSPLVVKIRSFEDSSIWSKKRRVDVQINLQSAYEENFFASAIFTFDNISKGFEITAETPDDRVRLANISKSFAAPTLEDASKLQAHKGTQAKELLLAATYKKNLGLGDDQLETSDPKNLISLPQIRLSLFRYCKSLKDTSRDSLCDNWESLDPIRTSLKQQMWRANNDPTLKAARIAWADKACPKYNPRIGMPSCFAGKDSTAAGYIVTTAAVTHTRDASKFGLALAKIVSDSSKDLATLVATKLPASRRQAAELERSASRTQKQKMIVSQTDVELALAKLDKAIAEGAKEEIVTANYDLMIKKMRANDSFYETGAALPYPEYP